MTTGFAPAGGARGPAGGVLAGTFPDPAFSAATLERWTTETTEAQAGAAYQLALGDVGKMVRMTNAGANTVTIPADATVDFPIGSWIDVAQWGAGDTTITPAAGVSLFSMSDAVSAAFLIQRQYGIVRLRKIAANSWLGEGAGLRPSCSTAVAWHDGGSWVVATGAAGKYLDWTSGSAGWWVIGQPTRLTMPADLGGVAVITGRVQWDASNTGTYRNVGLRLNGSGFSRVLTTMAPSSRLMSQTVICPPVGMNPGDYVELFVDHDSGVNRNIIDGLQASSLHIEYMGRS